jgi:hypothetical protein
VQDSDLCGSRSPALNIGKNVFQKALAWSIGGSKADLLELKVAAWAVVTSGLDRDVQCIPQQMHELRPFPVPDHHKVLQNRFCA